MSDPEIELDQLPAPGEPLTPRIHEDNQRLLDEELAERARRIQARLTRWQIRRMKRRHAALWHQLNRANYNPLITERFELMRQCTRLKHEVRNETDPNRCQLLRREMKDAAIRGLQVDAELEPLKPLADEFEDISRKFKAHNELLDWEKEDAENYAAFQREAVVWREQIKATMRQTPRMHHRGTDSEGREFCHIPVIEQIIFKTDRVLYQIKTSGQGIFERFTGRWHSALPYGVDIKSLTCDETLENLSAGCNRVVTVERSKSGTNLFYCISRLDAPDGIPKKILYQMAVNWYPREDHAKTPWAAGVTDDRKVKWFNFEDHPHVLIAGSTQSGKSNHLNTMIATSCTYSTPEQVRVLFIDLKGGVELTHWEGVKHALRPMVTKKEDVLEALQFLRAIMERRLEVFTAIKAKNLTSYNQKAHQPLPRIICFVDELATLIGLGSLTTDIHNELRVISSQGRAAGVHLVLCTQHPSVDVLPGWIKTNLTLRIASKMPSHTASIIVLDTISAALLPDNPGRMVFSQGRIETIAQSPFISDAEIERSVKASQELFADPDNSEFDQATPLEGKAKFSREDAIEMALHRFDGKLSPTRIFDAVGNEVIAERAVRNLIEDIVDEWEKQGSIEYGGCLYKLRKNRKTWVLEPTGQAAGQNMPDEQEEFNLSDSPIEEVAV